MINRPIGFSEDLVSDDIKRLVEVRGVCKKILALLDFFVSWSISTSVIFTYFNFSCFNLGIGSLLNEGFLCGCVMIVPRLCVSFNPFCE